jgi:hypothetical protein
MLVQLLQAQVLLLLVINASSKYVATSDGVDAVSIVLADGANLAAPITVTFAAGTTGVTATDTDITSTVVTDLTAFAAANPGACPTIRLTSVPTAVKQYCNINTQYYKQRMPVMTVSFAQSNSTSLGFDCNGTIVTVQDPVFALRLNIKWVGLLENQVFTEQVTC